jgi:hypothetical protein
MGLFKKADRADEIGRTAAPTAKEIKRYNKLRDSGMSPLEATRKVRSEARRKQK